MLNSVNFIIYFSQHFVTGIVILMPTRSMVWHTNSDWLYLPKLNEEFRTDNKLRSESIFICDGKQSIFDSVLCDSHVCKVVDFHPGTSFYLESLYIPIQYYSSIVDACNTLWWMVETVACRSEASAGQRERITRYPKCSNRISISVSLECRKYIVLAMHVTIQYWFQPLDVHMLSYVCVCFHRIAA